MKLNRVGFVGWRGMVGSVLLQRMIEENDFSLITDPTFFTTSQTGQNGPDVGKGRRPLVNANDIATLKTMDAIVTCQGGDYTSDVHARLRQQGWEGYWIDAASTLRMASEATIILDPVNLPIIEQALADGRKDFIGGNCTVSLMMMALDGLLNANLVEWISVMTYQAISGGGARQMEELVTQMGQVYANSKPLLEDGNTSILDLDKVVIDTMRSDQLASSQIGYPLVGNLLPWIDKDLDSGTSREEWKGSVETNKILARDEKPIPIESTCIRIGAMRCHSQAFTIKLTKDIPLEEIEAILDGANDWVSVIPNEREASLEQLTPASVTGTLNIPIGRVRKLHMGGDFMSAFTVGDQLLWGAAEPLRRMLRILSEHASGRTNS
ncbi:MAG: aspartate-semialdehyde dehydrogenase [Gammaproteobacteria bacterium]|nr:aspartate-semialdehyde dehydrogenase [Gammaproteobacteria bacterium]